MKEFHWLMAERSKHLLKRMSEKYVAHDHQDPSLYLTNKGGIPGIKSLMLKNPDIFNGARKTSLTSYLGAFKESMLRILKYKHMTKYQNRDLTKDFSPHLIHTQRFHLHVIPFTIKLN